jgi:site-specific DNA recombinase
MRVFIYNRKSEDKEDAQILSIQGQKDENQKRAERFGYTIVDVYDEEQTAKEPGRRKFNEMMQRFEAGEAEGIVCWRLNRLARNPIDGGQIQWNLQKNVIKSITTSEKTYLPTDNVIQMAVEFGMSTQFSIDLSKDVKRGMGQKVKLGWKPGRPALGYMRDDAGLKGAKEVKVDDVRFNQVRLMWDELLSRAYTVPQIWQRSLDRGLNQPGSRRHTAPKPLQLSTLYRVFTNPFYYGEYKWGGEMRLGKHIPMITRQEYDEVQLILGDKGRPRAQTHENPYACLLHCGECQSMIVMDPKRKFIKSENIVREYQYFRCSKRRGNCKCLQQGSIDRDEIDKQLLPIIAAAWLPQSIIEWSLQKLQCSQEDKKRIYQEALKHLRTEEERAEAKLNNLVDLRLENPSAFTPESFEHKRKELEAALTSVQKKLRDREAAAKVWRDDVLDGVKFLEGVHERFTFGNPGTRLDILRRLGQRLELKDKKVTFELTEPYFSLKEARDAVEQAIGSLEPLDYGLDKVEKGIFEIAISVWSGIRESNPHLKLGKLAYYHCTNPAFHEGQNLRFFPSWTPLFPKEDALQSGEAGLRAFFNERGDDNVQNYQ